MHAERGAWATASVLVNLALSSRFIATTDLDIMQNLGAICYKAWVKMGRQQEGHVAQLLARFNDQVRALSNMLQASKSMRASSVEDKPLIMYSNGPSVEGDLGDGAGAPVFATLPIAVYEKMAEEIVSMHETELKQKILEATNSLKFQWISKSFWPSRSFSEV